MIGEAAAFSHSTCHTCPVLHFEPSILVRPILAEIEGKRAVPIRACHHGGSSDL